MVKNKDDHHAGGISRRQTRIKTMTTTTEMSEDQTAKLAAKDPLPTWADEADAQETQWADSVARLTHAASTGPVPRRNLAVSALAYADRLRTQGRLADGLAQMSRVLTLIGA